MKYELIAQKLDLAQRLGTSVILNGTNGLKVRVEPRHGKLNFYAATGQQLSIPKGQITERWLEEYLNV